MILIDIYLLLSDKQFTWVVPTNRELIFKLPLKLNFKSIHYTWEDYFKAIEVFTKMHVNWEWPKIMEIYVRLFEAECCHHSWSSFILPFPKRMSEYKTYWFYSVLKADALSLCVMEKTLNSFMEMLDNDVFLARKLRQGINVLWYFELIDIWGLSLALSVAFKYIFCLQPVIGDKWESQINICSLMPTILLLIIFHIQEDFW